MPQVLKFNFPSIGKRQDKEYNGSWVIFAVLALFIFLYTSREKGPSTNISRYAIIKTYLQNKQTQMRSQGLDELRRRGRV